MGLVVSVDSIFVLGGSPLSMKQYQRIPGASDGVHKLVNQFVERLCYPTCDSWTNGVKPGVRDAQTKCPPNAPDGSTTWDGRSVQGNEQGNENPSQKVFACWRNTAETEKKGSVENKGPCPWHPDMSTVSIAEPSMHNAGAGALPTNWAANQALWAGGALALDTETNSSNVLRVYGLTHCGTLFFAEPKERRAAVLFHFLLHPPAIYLSSHQIRSSLAVQRYSTPVGDVSKAPLFIPVHNFQVLLPELTRNASLYLQVFISISTKPPSMRFDTRAGSDVQLNPVTGVVKYIAKSKVYMVHVNALLKCRNLADAGTISLVKLCSDTML